MIQAWPDQGRPTASVPPPPSETPPPPTMKAATWGRSDPASSRLLWIDPVKEQWVDGGIGDLTVLLNRGDLLVVNDSSTLPASLKALSSCGEEVEVRLLARRGVSPVWQAVLFGSGDWRTPTEHRPPPPPLKKGERLFLGGNLEARVEEVDPRSERLVELTFNQEGEPLWTSLYAQGRPVQYSYLGGDLPLEAVQTSYGGPPWAVEMPSAGRPLSGSLLLGLRRRGVRMASVTHAAGLSATGDEGLDSLLPLPERYHIPEATVQAVAEARSRRGRVIAVGTSTVRALEGGAQAHGGLRVAGEGETDLVMDGDFIPQVVDGVLTLMHDPGESHFRLIQAFAPRKLLLEAWQHAVEQEYLAHEFGDSTLVLGSLPVPRHGGSSPV